MRIFEPHAKLRNMLASKRPRNRIAS
jgi:hypothetical protein